MKKSTIFRLSLIAAVCGLFILQSCEKDPVTPPVDNSASVKPYIIVRGVKFVCAQPSSLYVSGITGDSQLIWKGTGFSDTIIWISHQKNEVKVGSYKVDSTGFGDPGFISSSIRWGTLSSSPIINLAKGTYELKRENGKFVSYLKNGEGYHGLNHNQRFYNVEFKVVWPY
jgi:hypothetical protein